MNISIIVFPSKRRSNEPIFGEARQMQQAAISRGHQSEVYNSQHFSFLFDGKKTQLWYQHEKFKAPDVFVAWVGMLNHVAERTAVLEEIEIMGIPVLNRRIPVVRTRNKFQTMQILSSKGLPIIKTVMIHELESLDLVLEQIGDFPVVAKTIYGNDGKGVAIFESKRSLQSGLELMLDNQVQAEHVLIQEFIKTDNKDYRLFVVGDEVVATMERTAAEGDFRANLSSGGSARNVELSDDIKELAVKASKALDMDISGVDILLSEDGPVICEVNPRPGFKIKDITGVDVAEKIIMHAEKVLS